MTQKTVLLSQRPHELVMLLLKYGHVVNSRYVMSLVLSIIQANDPKQLRSVTNQKTSPVHKPGNLSLIQSLVIVAIVTIIVNQLTAYVTRNWDNILQLTLRYYLAEREDITTDGVWFYVSYCSVTDTIAKIQGFYIKIQISYISRCLTVIFSMAASAGR